MKKRRVVEVVTLRHGAQQRFPVVRAFLRFLTGFAQRAAAHAERDNLRQRLHSFFMVRTSQAQSCRSCHLWHGAQQRFPVVRAYLRFLTGFAQRAAAHAERDNLRQRLHSFFMVTTRQAQSCRSCHLRHGAQQRFPVVRAFLRFLTGFAQRAAAHAERDNLRQRLHSFFMVRTSQAQSCRSCHLRHGAQQRFPVVRAYLRFLTGFAQRAAAHAERDNLRQRLHSFFMVRASPAQSCRSCHLRHGAQQRFPVVRAYLRFLTGFAQRAAAHAERDNLRQRLHSFFMVRTSQAQSCRSCHLWHGAQQRFPVVRAYLRFLTGFAQRAAAHAERDNLRQRLHSFFMVRASPAQSCRSCHVRHGAQQRLPVVRAHLRFLTGFAQRAAAHAERDNLRQRLHSFFMVRASPAQSCRSCHLRHGAQQRFPVVRAYLRFLTGFVQRAAAHAERDNLRQRLHSFFMVRTSQAQSCRSCHVRHGAQQRFPVVRAFLRFLTGFAQRAAAHAERDNLRQRLHSFFMVRTSQAQSCRSCHLRHGAQQRFPVVRAYLRFLTGFAQRAAAHAERDNLRQRLHSFFMVRQAQRRVVEVVTSGMERNSDFQSCAHTCAFSQVLRSALRRMPSVTTCASAYTASSWSGQAQRRVVEVVTSGMERNSDFQSCAHTCAFSQVLRSALRRMPSVTTCASAYTASSWSGQAQRRVVEVVTSGMERNSDFQSCAHTCAFSQVLRSALRRMPSVTTCASAYTASSWSGQAQRRVVEVVTSGMERNSDFQSCAHTCAFSQVLRSALRRMPSVTTCASAYTASSWLGQAKRRVVEVVTSGMERNSDFQSCAHTCAFSQVLRSALRRMPSVTTCASAYTASSWSGQAKRRVVEVVTSGMERNSDFQSCAHTCAFSQVLRSALRRMPSVTTCASAYTASSWLGQAKRRVVEVVTSGMERNSDFQSCAHTCAFSQVLRSAVAAHAERDNLRQRLHSFFMVRASQAQSCRSCHLRHGAQQRFPVVRAYLRFLTGFAQRAAAHAERDNLRQRLHSFFMVRTSPAQSCRSCHLRHGAQQRFPVVRAYLRFLTGFAQRAALRRMPNVTTCASAYTASSCGQAKRRVVLSPPAWSATAISSRARILALSHRFCAARCGACRA